MIQFKIEIMVIGVRSHSDFLYDHPGCLGLHLLLFLFHLIKKLFIIDDLAYWRTGARGDLNQVESQILRNDQGLPDIVDSLFNIFTDNTDYG
jgi:hypothetical protein